MRLFEFQLDDPLRIKLVAATNQLKSRMEDTANNEPMSTDAFLSLLRNKYDITIDKSDLFDMVKKDPMKNIIDNINGNEIIFKGQRSNELGVSPDEAEQTVAKMAHRASNKLK
jgi:hypothetical protein